MGDVALDFAQAGHGEDQRSDDSEEDGEADDAVAQRARMRRQVVVGLRCGRYLFVDLFTPVGFNHIIADQTARILVVDDEPAVQTALSRALKLERYEVAQAADGREALERLDAMTYEVVILDVSMPQIDGLEVCRRLREGGDRTPVLMLTAREGVDDRVAGLDAGADDYLVKPFALRELLARVRALLRRASDDDSEQDNTLTFEDLRLDRLAHEAWRGERMLPLTRTEFLLLEMFLRHPRQVLSRSAIFEGVWGYDFGASSNSLGVYIGYLRRKTEAGEEPRLLHTVRGVGYVLRT